MCVARSIAQEEAAEVLRRVHEPVEGRFFGCSH